MGMQVEREATKSPMAAIHEFAQSLTTLARELEEKERTWQIGPGEAAKILEQMIEAQLYSVFKAMHMNARARDEDREAAARAMRMFETTRSEDSAFVAYAIERMKSEN